MDSTETVSRSSKDSKISETKEEDCTPNSLGKWIDILPNYFSNQDMYPNGHERTLTKTFGSSKTLASCRTNGSFTQDSRTVTNTITYTNNNSIHSSNPNLQTLKNNIKKTSFHNSSSFSNNLSKLSNNNNVLNEKYSAKKSLSNYGNGYEINKKIATTLQGSVYEGYDCISKDVVVVKRTDVRLHENKQAFIDGRTWNCNEDIIKEKNLIQFLSLNNPPKYGFVKMLDFFHDDYNYFLIMEHGGKPFRKHIVTCHQFILKGKLTIDEYKRHTKVLFHQIIIYVDWLHSIGVCHLDISIENLLIKGARLKNGKFTNDGGIYFCDYGLAESFFKKQDFKSKKFKIGKPGYKSREVFKEIEFDARLADIWSIGVCLFIMIIGARPFDRPSFTDNSFNNIMSGYIKQMLIDNKKIEYIDNNAIDLLSKIFIKESKRIDAKTILKHKYCKNIQSIHILPKQIKKIQNKIIKVINSSNNISNKINNNKSGGFKKKSASHNSLFNFFKSNKHNKKRDSDNENDKSFSSKSKSNQSPKTESIPKQSRINSNSDPKHKRKKSTKRSTYKEKKYSQQHIDEILKHYI